MKKKLTFLLSIILITALLFSCSNMEQNNVDVVKMTVCVRMMDMQQHYFKKNIIQPFENKYNAEIDIVSYENEDELIKMLLGDSDVIKSPIALIKTEANYLAKLDGLGFIVHPGDIEKVNFDKDKKEYLDDALDMVTIDGEVAYIPRKLETHTLLYMETKVKDAVNNWEPMHTAIDEMFKTENGYGLPDNYELEADPNEWDWYDIAVVSYYWANTEYDGKTVPRMAHRGKNYDGLTTELVSKAYQCGADQEDVYSMQGERIREMFRWEAFMTTNGLYKPEMWKEEYTGGTIWNAMKHGEVYMAFMNQIDAFFIHGGSNDEMRGYVENPDDMKIAIMPAGASLDIEYGEPLFLGAHTSQLGGWGWGIAETSPDLKMSYELARFITNKDNNLAEINQFGMYTVRKDIAEDFERYISEEWKLDVLNTSKRQFEVGVIAMPKGKNWSDIGKSYNKAWIETVNTADTEKTIDIIDKYRP